MTKGKRSKKQDDYCDVLNKYNDPMEVFSIIPSSLEGASSKSVYLYDANYCRLVKPLTLLTALINEVHETHSIISAGKDNGSNLDDNVRIYSVERKGKYTVYLVEQLRCDKCSIRYTVFPQISSILVEYRNYSWLIQFYCSNLISYARYSDELNLSEYSQKDVGKALFPLYIDPSKISSHVIILYASYTSYHIDNGVSIGLDKILLGKPMNIEEKVDLAIGVTSLKKAIEIDNQGAAWIKSYLIPFSLGQQSLEMNRRALLALFGLSMVEYNSGKGIILDSKLAEYVGLGFSPYYVRGENAIARLLKSSIN